MSQKEMGIKMSETEENKPPSSKVNMDFISRNIPTSHSFLERLANLWTIWSSDWDIPPIRGFVYRRCLFVSKDF